MEEWRDIKGYEGIYQVSNEGRIKSLERYVNGNGRNQCQKLIKEKILNGTVCPYGYLAVTLHDENGQKQYKIHRLVAETFIPNPENKPQIDHINTITNDNRVSNLRWCTPTENTHNPITLDRIVKARQSDDFRKLISKLLKGRTFSDETIKKMSDARKGVGCVKVNQYSKDGVYIATYNSIDEARGKLGLCSGDICRCCKGIRKTCGGFVWKYA